MSEHATTKSPDDPRIIALATRIERAMRLSREGREASEKDLMHADLVAIRELQSGFSSRLRLSWTEAGHPARIHWLAGVLAGAMGRAEQPKPKGEPR
jgi:hypothetical protein